MQEVNKESFKALRKFIFKSAKDAAIASGTPYQTWVSWESADIKYGSRRCPPIALAWLRERFDRKMTEDATAVSGPIVEK